MTLLGQLSPVSPRSNTPSPHRYLNPSFCPFQRVEEVDPISPDSQLYATPDESNHNVTFIMPAESMNHNEVLLRCRDAIEHLHGELMQERGFRRDQQRNHSKLESQRLTLENELDWERNLRNEHRLEMEKLLKMNNECEEELQREKENSESLQIRVIQLEAEFKAAIEKDSDKVKLLAADRMDRLSEEWEAKSSAWKEEILACEADRDDAIAMRDKAVAALEKARIQYGKEKDMSNERVEILKIDYASTLDNEKYEMERRERNLRTSLEESQKEKITLEQEVEHFRRIVEQHEHAARLCEMQMKETESREYQRAIEAEENLRQVQLDYQASQQEFQQKLKNQEEAIQVERDDLRSKIAELMRERRKTDQETNTEMSETSDRIRELENEIRNAEESRLFEKTEKERHWEKVQTLEAKVIAVKEEMIKIKADSSAKNFEAEQKFAREREKWRNAVKTVEEKEFLDKERVVVELTEKETKLVEFQERANRVYEEKNEILQKLVRVENELNEERRKNEDLREEILENSIKLENEKRFTENEKTKILQKLEYVEEKLRSSIKDKEDIEEEKISFETQVAILESELESLKKGQTRKLHLEQGSHRKIELLEQENENLSKRLEQLENESLEYFKNLSLAKHELATDQIKRREGEIEKEDLLKTINSNRLEFEEKMDRYRIKFEKLQTKYAEKYENVKTRYHEKMRRIKEDLQQRQEYEDRLRQHIQTDILALKQRNKEVTNLVYTRELDAGSRRARTDRKRSKFDSQPPSPIPRSDSPRSFVF